MPPAPDTSDADESAQFLDRYSDAPPKMPSLVRAVAEAELNGGVIFYALSDLDAEFRFHRLWVVLGKTEIVLIREDGGRAERVLGVARKEIGTVRVDEGLSCSKMNLVGAGDGTVLASFQYTRRYHAGFESLRSVIEFGGDCGQSEPDTEAADAAYREAVAGSLGEGQPGSVISGTRVIGRLLRYLRPYRRMVAIGLGAAAMVALLGLIPPFLTGQLLDSILSGLERGGGIHGAWLLIGLITAAAVMRSLFLWIRLHLMSILGERVAHDLRRDVYGHVQNLSLGYFSKAQTGTVVSRVGSDTDRIWEFVTFGIAEAILSGFTLLTIGTVLLVLDWRLGLVMLAPLPILLWAILQNGRAIQGGFTKAWRHWASLHAVIGDTIPGIRVVKGFGQEKRERERFDKENAAVFEAFNEVHSSWTRFWPVLSLALHGIGLAVYWIAFPRIGDSVNPLTPGLFVTFLLYSWMFIQPVETFAQMGRMVSRALSSARRVFELLDTASESVGSDGKRLKHPIRGEIVFNRVGFGYQKFRPVFRDISFNVEEGEMIGIAGRSGAGKSSLIQLLPRFFDFDHGEILLDGNDIRDIDLETLRGGIGIVDQDPFLFHGTVLENIRYGRPEATASEVIAAARIADAHSFISRLPLGYDSVVGERGASFSGGERQRVSLARTLLSKPRILILDEATSNVDGESESRIYEALKEATVGCTTIIIAHRLTALRHAERILVLEDGSIQGEGSYQELVDSDPVFRRLYHEQIEAASGEGGAR